MKSILLMAPLCPLRVEAHSPLDKSQILIKKSAPPVMTTFPLGRKREQVTSDK